MTIGRIVKAELKKAFPAAKFSVKSDYDSVRISWENGPSEQLVEEIAGKYEMGNFNGMTDSYDFTKCRDDIPQVKYVFLSRTISEESYQAKFDEYKKYYASWENITGLDDCSVPMKGYSPRGFIRHELLNVCL